MVCNLESSILFMIITGVTASVAFILLFTAYRIASPSVVSPFEYSILYGLLLVAGYFLMKYQP